MPGYLGRTKSSSKSKPKKDSGGLFGIDLPKLGIKETISGIGKGAGALAWTLPVNTLRGNLDPLNNTARGLASSFIGTGLSAVDAATLGKAHSITDPMRDTWGDVLGGEQYRPESLTEQYRRGGIAGVVAENVGNVAIGGAIAGKLGSLGTVGRLGAAELAASKAGGAGISVSRIAEAADAAKLGRAGLREAGIKQPLLRQAGKTAARAEGLTANPAAVASRAKTLGKLEGVAHPYKSMFSDVIAPLGKAATAASAVPETPTVRMWRTAEKAEDGTRLFTPDQALADGAATGKLRYVDVPEAVAAETGTPLADTVVHKLPEDLAKKAKKFVPDRPQGYPDLPAEEVAKAAAAAPVPEWAAGVVNKLPDVANAGLRKADRVIEARRVKNVVRERIRAQDIDRRKAEASGAGKVTVDVSSEHLVGKVLPDGTEITPDLADKLIGDEIIAQNELVDALEKHVLKDSPTPEQTAAVRESLQKSRVRSAQNIPAEWLRNADGTVTAMGKAIEDVAELWRAESPKKVEELRSNRTGGVGLEGVGARVPTTGSRVQSLLDKADGAVAAAAKLEETAVPKELGKLAKEAERVQSSIAKIDEKVAAGREAMQAAMQKIAESRKQSVESMQPQKTIPWVDKLTGETHDIAVPTKPVSPRQAMVPSPKLPGSTYAHYRSGVTGGTSATVSEGFAKAEKGLLSTKAKLEKTLAKLQQDIAEGAVPSKAEADKLRATAEKAAKRAAVLETMPKLKDVPQAFKPAWHAFKSLHKDAETNPILADLLEGSTETWDTIMKVTEEAGFDPTHTRSFSQNEIQQLIYESVRLGNSGRDIGKTLVAGTQKARSNPATRTRSFSALLAATAEATHATHTNAVADLIDSTYARKIPSDGKVMTLPDGWGVWDSERRLLLSGEKTPKGTVIAVGAPGAPTMMVPNEVLTVLRAYQRDFSHPILKKLATGTSLWRTFILTLSPKWYANNFAGNVAGAVKEGVTMQDFVAAFKSYRMGGPKSEANRLIQKLGAGKDSFSDALGAVSGSVATEGFRSTLIPYPSGAEGVKMANRVSRGDAIKLVQSRVGRMNEVVDEISRVAVYKSHMRRGATEAHALNRTYQALVDYNDLTPLERQGVRAVLPFYAWQKGILKLVSRFPIDHPIGAAISMQLAEMQREQLEKELGGPVPEGYGSIIKLPGLGYTNMRSLNPFQDAGQLASPQGIAASMNPFVESLLRNIMGAPDGGFAKEYRVDEYGNAVPDTSPARDLTNIVTGLPQFRLGESALNRSASGIPPKGRLRAAGNFVGISTLPEEQVKRAVARTAKSRKRVER